MDEISRPTVLRVIFQGCQDVSFKCAPEKLERIQRVSQKSAREPRKGVEREREGNTR